MCEVAIDPPGVFIEEDTAMSKSNYASAGPVDFRVENYGSIFIVRCESELAKQALLEFVEPNAQWIGDALAVAPRLIGGLVSSLRENGWQIR